MCLESARWAHLCRDAMYYISTKRLPNLGKGAPMVTDTRYNFCTPNEKGGDGCQQG